ncbi:glycoside hydrolase domain-containing protein [Kribbella deserti]|uniref:Glycoside hydrolase domain-containing protein n=1 Tax=Kribbella deserti TaxID=1926257 RepID=A0ABV6QTJ7_9ACTN
MSTASMPSGPEGPTVPSRRQVMTWMAAAGAVTAAAPGLADPMPAQAATTRAAVAPVTVWLPSPNLKVRRDFAFPGSPGTRVSLKAARNEEESGQLILRTTSGTADVRLSASDLTGSAGTIPAARVELFRQHYLEIRPGQSSYGSGFYPDALIPLLPYTTMSVVADRNSGVWITVRIPKGQPAGLYSGTITISGGTTVVTVPLDLEVWNFEVPDKPSTDTAAAIWYQQVAWAHDAQWGTTRYDDLLKKYYEFQLRHRLASDDFPVRAQHGPGPYKPGPGPEPEPDVWLAHAERYLHDPRLKRFRIPLYTTGGNDSGFHVDTGRLRHVVDGLRAMGGGLIERGYFYYADEPMNDAAYEHVRKLFATVDTIAPDIPHVLTLTDPPPQKLLDFVHAWAFVLTAPKPELPGLVESLKARGDLVWWYAAYGHQWPIPGVFTADSAVGHRLLPWIQHHLGIEGFLFWSTTVFGKYDFAPDGHYQWADRWTDPNALNEYPGDGYLLYPGKQVGIDGPVGTVRLQALRDGFEDLEYLALYERRATELLAQWGATGRFDVKAALRSAHDVLHGGLSYKDDSVLFHQIRAQVGAEVAQLFGSSPALISVGKPTAHNVPVTVIVAKGTSVTIAGSNSLPVESTAGADIHRIAADLPAGRTDLMVTVAGRQLKRTIEVGAAATPHQIIINSFETDVEVRKARASYVTATRSAEHVVTGKSSAKLVFQANTPVDPGVYFYTGAAEAPQESIGRNNWSTIDAIAFDVFNDSNDLIVLYCDFHDPVKLDAHNPAYLLPGQQRVLIPLAGLVNDLSKITSIHLRVQRRGTPLTLYLDNLRFLRSRTGLPSTGTWARQDATGRPLVHAVRSDGNLVIGRQTGSDPAAWQLTTGPAASGPTVSAIDPAGRLNLVSLRDGVIEWTRDEGSWVRRTVTPQLSGDTAVGVPGIALDAAGRLNYFVRTSSGRLYRGWQNRPTSDGWSGQYIGTVTVTGDPVTLQDPAGKLTWFAQTTGGNLQHGWQVEPGSQSWQTDLLYENGTGAPATVAGRIAVAQGISGRLTFHARHSSGGIIHGWQNTPGDGPWRWALLPRETAEGVVTVAGDPAVHLDAAGKLTYFARTTDGRILHGWQRIPEGGPWDTTIIPVQVVGDGAVTQDTDGRLHYFARTAAGTLRHCWQDAPAIGPWHSNELGSGVIG